MSRYSRFILNVQYFVHEYLISATYRWSVVFRAFFNGQMRLSVFLTEKYPFLAHWLFGKDKSYVNIYKYHFDWAKLDYRIVIVLATVNTSVQLILTSLVNFIMNKVNFIRRSTFVSWFSLCAKLMRLRIKRDIGRFESWLRSSYPARNNDESISCIKYV